MASSWNWLWVLAFAIIGSIGGLAGTLVLLVCPPRVQSRLLPHLLSYGTGTLLGVAFLGLLPHALEKTPAEEIMLAALAGVLLIFTLEKVMLWRHCHDPHCEAHNAMGTFILIGDAIHNFIDGVTMGAAFLVSVPLGVATGLAVLIHELPQEIGDFAILIESGYPKKRAFWLNMVAGLTTIPGALMTFFGLRQYESAVPFLLAVAGSSFIYVACGHLIPTLHRRSGLLVSLQQVTLIAAGVATIALMHHH